MTLNDLQPHERLLLWRHRAQLSQAQAAFYLGVSHGYYGKWERGAVPLSHRPPLRTPPKPHEECLVRRLRAGLLHRDLAVQLKRCRFWIGEMERGRRDCAELLTYLRGL